MMKKLSIASTVLVFSAAILGAQGKHGGGGPPMHTASVQHSNAPAGTPKASADRDLGRSRAEDVGKGEKKGLQKNVSRQKSKRVVKHSGNK
jgi:hypothetical protein